MRKFFICLSILLPLAVSAGSDVKTDSIATTLDEVVVEGRNQRLGAEVSTYIPTAKQKNAAQTAADLLNRMAIPQLRVSPSDDVTNLAGKNVDIFIDFLPASKDDLDGMRLQDVKKVEYYDFPTDPRFQGKPYVVNFVMQKYEYGGYVKAYGWGVNTDAAQITLYSKLQYKRMTFDFATGLFRRDDRHTGSDTYETFRLPQSDGSLKVFERYSIQDDSHVRDYTCWPTFKALYSSDKIVLQNVIGAYFNHKPKDELSGHILYTPEVSPRTDFADHSTERVNSLTYSGNWNFIINKMNSITFAPQYAYSHTNSFSHYQETGAGEYLNAAKDDSHQFKGDLTYSHSFGKWGTLNTMFKSIITGNRTSYSGTANTSDDAHIYRFGPGAQYSLSKGKVYGMIGFGYNWDRQEYLNYKECSAFPWFDFSLQYSPNNRHSLTGDFHKSNSIPPSGSRSSAIIQSNPLMQYTGNPDLVSYKSYDAGVSYSYVPNNKLTLSAFANTFIAQDRYVYDYEPTATGILRTIRQPGGAYSHWNYGAYGTLRLFERKLQLMAQVLVNTVHNGEPYNYDKTQVNYALQATYYLDNWTFSGLYYAPQGYPGGPMVGSWMRTKSYYKLQAGWSNSTWNLQLQVAQFARWNWRSDKSILHSPFYDKTEQTYSISDHAFVRLSVTYTFGFGKKVSQGEEATQQSAISSGILR